MENYSNVANATREPLHERNSPEAISETATLIVIMIASFFANILAMTQILSSKKLRKNHHNLLIANLNVIDLGITLFSMTFSVAAIFDDGALLRNYPIICTLNGFCAITCSVGNFTNVMCIAVDRYISIVWSTRFPPTRRRVYFMIAFVWVVSITITLPPTFEFLSAFEYTEQTHHCSPRWDVCSYYLIWFTVIFGVTVPVMIVCYACIIYHIRKSDKQLRFYDGIKASAKISKQLSGSKVGGSLQSSPNLGTNAVHNSHHHDHRRLQQLTTNAQHDNKNIIYQNGDGEAQTNNGFQADKLDIHDIEINEKTFDNVGPGPFVISGQIDERSASQSLTTFGQSEEETNVRNQDSRLTNSQRTNSQRTNSQRTNGQRLTSPTHSRSRALENGQRQRGHTISDPGANLDAALNKLSARKSKLSTDKRVACTGAMLILTTIFCWAPYCIIHFCNFPTVSHSVAAATMWMAYANALLDPLVYVFMNRKESTIQHLSSIVRTFCDLPRKIWRRFRGKGPDF